MGRWVTSKGRRIYIPDEGEKVPEKYQKNVVKGVKDTKSKDFDLSTDGTYKLNGQGAPKDLPKVSDEEAKNNKMVEYKGTKYSTQQVVDYDKENGGEYVAGHMYVPHNDLNKGSFFVSKDGEMYHSGSDYLNAKSRKKMEAQINKDFDTKEKQIAENKAQKDKLNGKGDIKTLSKNKRLKLAQEEVEKAKGDISAMGLAEKYNLSSEEAGQLVYDENRKKKKPDNKSKLTGEASYWAQRKTKPTQYGGY